MAEDCEDKKKESLRHLARGQAFELQPKENKLRPSSLPRCGRASPQGEALTQGKASHFCRKKMKAQNFFRQGEDMQRPLQSAEADSFPDGEAGNAG